MNVHDVLKRTAITVFACMVTLGASSAALADPPITYLSAAPLFEDIGWGTSADAVKAAMASRGYTFDAAATAKYAFHDLRFSGKTQGVDSEVIDFLDPQRKLVKISVNLLTKAVDCERIYNDAAEALMEKYGEPTTKEATYESPFIGEETDFIPAIKAGKAKFADQWLGSPGNTYAVYTSVEQNLTVTINYESQEWAAEYTRREK